ncbi:MAG: hypothetical protein ABR606_01980 [Vicinamibacterales bacterium]
MAKPVRSLSALVLTVAVSVAWIGLGQLEGTVLAQNEATPAVRSLGHVVVPLGVVPCNGEDCYDIEVHCPDVREPATARLKVGDPTAVPLRGTILFMTGGGGTSLWEGRGGGDARRVLTELRGSGFRTVQIAWTRGWLVGTAEGMEGQASLGCRPATVARWVYDTLHHLGPDTALCATGNSGGAGQVSYMLSHYGLAEILSAAVPTGGPPFGRIDLGCLRYDPANSALWYHEDSAGLIDRGFGVLDEGSGACVRSDARFRSRFEEASIVSAQGSYIYPKTMVWFLWGENDRTNAVPQGWLYRDRLIEAGSPLVRADVVPDTGHGVPGSQKGADMIRDIMLNECRPR